MEAGALINATDVVSGWSKTILKEDAIATSTGMSVNNADGFGVGNVIYIDDGGKTETGTIASVSRNTINLIDGLIYSHNFREKIRVFTIRDTQHYLSFDVSNSAIVDSIRFQLSQETLDDEGSLADVVFSNLTGITGSLTPSFASSGMIIFDANPATLITEGSNIKIALDQVKHPNGRSGNTYSIVVETLNTNQQVIDRVQVFFITDTVVEVYATVNSKLSLTIDDDGLKNNPDDSVSDPSITLYNLLRNTKSDPVSGYGIDGNKLVVGTNATRGYTLSISDSQNGFVTPNFTGMGRALGDSDEGIDDISGGPTSWSGTGVEAYGYHYGISFDIMGSGNNYRAFTETPFVIQSAATSVNDEVSYITIRAQRSINTPTGDYSDTIKYIITPNF